ncbi:hypothetical protein TNCV_1202811 [Trichonephila clavipes]|nr:hypothetical protein TNCV_1202811 [Trichonephila clavipes]
MENTHRRPSGKRPKKRRFRGNQFMKVCSHTHVAEKERHKKNYSGSAGKMEVDGMLRIFNRSEKLHNLKYSNYIGDGDTKTFNALSENKPYGDDHLIQKIECARPCAKENGYKT